MSTPSVTPNRVRDHDDGKVTIFGSLISPGGASPPGDIRLRKMTHHLARAYSRRVLCKEAAGQKTVSTRKEVSMDRYPDRRSLLWLFPCDRGNHPLDDAEEHTSGIHALERTVTGRSHS